MRVRKVQVLALGLTLAASIACGGGSEPAPQATAEPSAAGGQKVDPANAGTVSGMVMLEGTAPKNEPIRMNADPVCVKTAQGPQFRVSKTQHIAPVKGDAPRSRFDEPQNRPSHRRLAAPGLPDQPQGLPSPDLE